VKVVINGAGIAGPTLAYWLQRAGHQVLLVEQAPQLRRGGYIIDFWGLGYDIAEKMGLIPRIRSQGYQVKEVRFVDKRGRRRGGFSTEAFQRLTGGRFTSLRRSDLAAAIYDAAAEHIETLFGDSVAGITDKGSAVEVSFVHAAPREADLVIGAGGLHSPVRQLAFGPDSDFEFPLGYYVAAFEIDGYQPRDELIFLTHGIPGRQISRFSMRDDKTLFLFVFESKYYPSEFPTTDEGRKAAVSTAFEGVGWECPQILAAMQDVGSIYFDRVSQIRMDSWMKGRVGLIGDAAAAVSLLAGEGTGLAMTEAYMLAGELRGQDGDYAGAFARYQERMRPFVQGKQESASKFASSFAPSSTLGVAVRNLATGLLRFPGSSDLLIGRNLHDDLVLPDFGF
jgi:2-polyprenyl-6-methoxyphenol hydroxylase-like FAD-dependent oxidoreductase